MNNMYVCIYILSYIHALPPPCIFRPDGGHILLPRVDPPREEGAPNLSCIYIYIHICIPIHIHICICIDIYTYTYILYEQYVCMYIYILLYIHAPPHCIFRPDGGHILLLRVDPPRKKRAPDLSV